METILFILWYGVQIFALWILSDLITGVVHWWQDTYGNPEWPLIGKYVVDPNLKHHKNPREMVTIAYWRLMRASIVTACVLMPLLWLCGWHSWRMVLCLAFSSQGNWVHLLAHRTVRENGKVITLLQKLGVFQSRRMHGWHHRAPYDTNFFILTDYLNPIFNKMKFFMKLERAVEKVFGIVPLRGHAIRGGV